MFHYNYHCTALFCFYNSWIYSYMKTSWHTVCVFLLYCLAISLCEHLGQLDRNPLLSEQ